MRPHLLLLYSDIAQGQTKGVPDKNKLLLTLRKHRAGDARYPLTQRANVKRTGGEIGEF